MSIKRKKALMNLIKQLNTICTNILIVKYSKHPKHFNINHFKRSCSQQIYDLLITDTARHYCMISGHASKYIFALVNNPITKYDLNSLYKDAYKYRCMFLSYCHDKKFLNNLVIPNNSYIQLYENIKNYDSTTRDALPNLVGIVSSNTIRNNLYHIYLNLEKILVSPISRELMQQPKNPLNIATFPKLPNMARIDNKHDKIKFSLTATKINIIRHDYLRYLLHFIKFSLLGNLCGSLKVNLQSLKRCAIIEKNILNDKINSSNSNDTAYDIKEEQSKCVNYLINQEMNLLSEHQDYHFLIILKILPNPLSTFDSPAHTSLADLIRITNTYINSCNYVEHNFLHRKHTKKDIHIKTNNDSSDSSVQALKLSKELITIIKEQNKLTHKKYKILKELNKLSFKSSK